MDDAVVLLDRAPAPGDAIRVLIEPKKVEVIAKLIELAIAGDPRSIELVLKYLAPPAKPDAERIAVPGLREAPTIKAKSLAIIDAVSNGLISVEAGEKVQRIPVAEASRAATRAAFSTSFGSQLEASPSGIGNSVRKP